jgi:MFS transporter, YNFM family, putative membrane transport protein
LSTVATTQAHETPTRTIALLAVAAFASAANLRICDPLLPQIAGELGVTVGSAASMVTAFAIAYGLSQLAVGPIGDARGKLPMVVLGSLLTGLATMLCAAMPTLGSLTIARFVAGAFAAAVIPLALAWMGDVIPYERRQPILARFLSGQILGVVFGQAAGGLLGDWMGWRAAMLLLGAVHIAAGLLLIVDLRGSPYLRIASGRTRWGDALASAIDILRRPWVRVVLITVFLEGLVMFGAFAYIGAELHHRFDLSFAMIGALLASFGAGALFYSLAASWMIARLGQRGLAAWGSLLLAGGYVVLAVTPWVWLVPLAIATMGLGFYMLHNTLQTNGTQMAPDSRGLAISLFAISLFIGQSVGVTLAAPVMDRFGARPIFLVTAVAVTLIAFWFRRQLIAREQAGA